MPTGDDSASGTTSTPSGARRSLLVRFFAGRGAAGERREVPALGQPGRGGRDPRCRKASGVRRSGRRQGRIRMIRPGRSGGRGASQGRSGRVRSAWGQPVFPGFGAMGREATDPAIARAYRRVLQRGGRRLQRNPGCCGRGAQALLRRQARVPPGHGSVGSRSSAPDASFLCLTSFVKRLPKTLPKRLAKRLAKTGAQRPPKR